MKKVLIIDTSILCVYLGVPGKETCGYEDNKWDKVKVDEILEREEKAKTIAFLKLVKYSFISPLTPLNKGGTA